MKGITWIEFATMIDREIALRTDDLECPVECIRGLKIARRLVDLNCRELSPEDLSPLTATVQARKSSVPDKFLHRLKVSDLSIGVCFSLIRVYFVHNFLGEYLYSHRRDLVPSSKIDVMTQNLQQLSPSIPTWPEVIAMIRELPPERKVLLDGILDKFLLDRNQCALDD